MKNHWTSIERKLSSLQIHVDLDWTTQVVHYILFLFTNLSFLKWVILNACHLENAKTSVQNSILRIEFYHSLGLCLLVLCTMCTICTTRSLGARWAPTSSWRPFGPAFCPSGLLDFVLRALWALRPCDPR